MKRAFEALVIGAGPAGGAAALALREAGRSVALVESRGFGGTCPLRGCNPKKVLLGPAEARSLAAHLAGKGIKAPPQVDWPRLAAFKQTFVEGKPEEIEAAYAKQGITTLHGQARFLDREHVAVGETIIRAAHVVLACGLKPRPLEFPGAEHVVISDAFLDLTALPRRIAFIGGGFISFEFAHAAAAAGAETVIIHRSRRALKGFDPELVEVLIKASRAAGIEVRLETPVAAVEKTGEGFAVLCGQGGRERIEADLVVHGAGRVADVDALNLKAAGVAVSAKGIIVSPYLQSTTNPRVYAVGDAAATPFALTPTGDMEGRVAAINILGGNVEEVDHGGVPRVVFSVPPLCAVGVLEEDLKAEDVPYRKVERDLADSFPWQRLGEDHARAKVLLDEESGRVLGAHMVGHMAEELANLFALVVRLGLSAEQVGRVVWAYPTCGYYLKYLLG